MSEDVSARAAAARSLTAFAKNGKYTNLEVASKLSKTDFSDADRKLYTTLVYGVAERMTTLDYIVSTLASREMEKIDVETLTALRLGLYQILYTDRIPPHAAVSSSVELAPKKSKGFVNALLREFQRRGGKYDLPTDPVKRMSVELSCPEAMCAFLTDKLGAENAGALLRSTYEKRCVTLRVNTLVTSAKELLKDVFPEGRVSPLSDDMIELRSLFGVDLNDRRYFVQDAASRLAVSALSPEPGDLVVDTCSAPGGKTFSAAIDMKNEGKIYSFDLHANKISLIKSGAERLGINIVEASCRDAEHPDESLAGKADRVICDAPCSGLGVISKKPDIKYKDPADIERLPGIQLRILRGASEYVKPGGVMIYSTCTVNPDENEGVARAFLEENAEFSAEPFTVGSISSDGMLTLFPHIHNTDGFFICKMRRAGGNSKE